MEYFFIIVGFIYLGLYILARVKGDAETLALHTSANVYFVAGFLTSLLNEISSKL